MGQKKTAWLGKIKYSEQKKIKEKYRDDEFRIENSKEGKTVIVHDTFS